MHCRSVWLWVRMKLRRHFAKMLVCERWPGFEWKIGMNLGSFCIDYTIILYLDYLDWKMFHQEDFRFRRKSYLGVINKIGVALVTKKIWGENLNYCLKDQSKEFAGILAKETRIQLKLRILWIWTQFSVLLLYFTTYMWNISNEKIDVVHIEALEIIWDVVWDNANHFYLLSNDEIRDKRSLSKQMFSYWHFLLILRILPNFLL